MAKEQSENNIEASERIKNAAPEILKALKYMFKAFVQDPGKSEFTAKEQHAVVLYARAIEKAEGK